jgi:hypothetical protein
METPSPRYILTRALFLIAVLVALLFAFGQFRKMREQSAIVAGLELITSDSTFFQQFHADDARKTLVRAVGLIARANEIGLPPDKAINRGLGVKEEFFSTDDRQPPPVREQIIRSCLRGNYDNFLKLGYSADFHTLESMRRGEMPPIPSGPHSGRKPEIAHLIDPALSPGMEKVVANLEIRPPREGKSQASDIEIAAARQLVRDLASAGIIEDEARDRILEAMPVNAP